MMNQASMQILSHYIPMSETEEHAALYGDIHREMSNLPLALQHKTVYEELEEKWKVNEVLYSIVYLHA